MNEIIVSREFNFNGGHKLKFEHREEKEIHGHNYEIRVSVKGVPDKYGSVIDLKELKMFVEKNVIGVLDERYLNSIIDNPTIENITLWIWNALKDIPGLHEVKVWENRKKGSCATYRGD